MGVAGEAFAGFRGLHAVFGLNPAVIHLAAWLCSWVKFICRDRGGLPGGLLLVLADCRPVRGEAVRGGAGKRCYGKSSGVAVLFEPAISDFYVICSILKSGVLYHLCCVFSFLTTSMVVTT